MGRKSKNKSTNVKKIIITIIGIAVIMLISYLSERYNFAEYLSVNNTENISTEIVENEENTEANITSETVSNTNININDIPEYSGELCVKINNNKPYFEENEYTTEAFEKYSELDSLGRCGVAYANICKEIMPPDGDERGNISSVHPTGWKQTKYNGEYLYNRCHLIAYCLAGENDNKQNLITGTRYFNVDGMLTIEKTVLEYMNNNTKNHVLYRVTPIFKDENLVATGVEMEGYSVEDNGKGICFNEFVYNVQPGVTIDYLTGKASF